VWIYTNVTYETFAFKLRALNNIERQSEGNKHEIRKQFRNFHISQPRNKWCERVIIYIIIYVIITIKDALHNISTRTSLHSRCKNAWTNKSSWNIRILWFTLIIDRTDITLNYSPFRSSFTIECIVRFLREQNFSDAQLLAIARRCGLFHFNLPEGELSRIRARRFLLWNLSIDESGDCDYAYF